MDPAAVVRIEPATRWTSQPGSWVGPENPYPGIEGQITWKASRASPPWATGSVRGPMILVNSKTEPGHPWVITTGSASGCCERAWMKWRVCPSMVVVN
jgi:hypothetical protein